MIQPIQWLPLILGFEVSLQRGVGKKKIPQLPVDLASSHGAPSPHSREMGSHACKPPHRLHQSSLIKDVKKLTGPDSLTMFPILKSLLLLLLLLWLPFDRCQMPSILSTNLRHVDDYIAKSLSGFVPWGARSAKTTTSQTWRSYLSARYAKRIKLDGSPKYASHITNIT